MKKTILLGITAILMGVLAAGTTLAQRNNCLSNPNVAISENVDCNVDSGIGVGLSRAQESVIIYAVNIYGTEFNGLTPGGVCLTGQGALLKSPTNLAPRTAAFAYQFENADGQQCTLLDAPATIVLIEGENPLASGVVAAPATTDDSETTASGTPTAATTTTTQTGTGSAELNNCTVVTRAILNFRDAPSISSGVIDLIPYRAILRVIGKTDGWYNVVFGSNNGWVAANLVNTRGRC